MILNLKKDNTLCDFNFFFIGKKAIFLQDTSNIRLKFFLVNKRSFLNSEGLSVIIMKNKKKGL